MTQQFQVKIEQKKEEERNRMADKRRTDKAQTRGEIRQEVRIAHYCSCDETPIKLHKTPLCSVTGSDTKLK